MGGGLGEPNGVPSATEEAGRGFCGERRPIVRSRRAEPRNDCASCPSERAEASCACGCCPAPALRLRVHGPQRQQLARSGSPRGSALTVFSLLHRVSAPDAASAAVPVRVQVVRYPAARDGERHVARLPVHLPRKKDFHHTRRQERAGRVHLVTPALVPALRSRALSLPGVSLSCGLCRALGQRRLPPRWRSRRGPPRGVG